MDKVIKNHDVIKQQSLARPYNVYNIFFILERARIVQAAIEHATNGATTPAKQLQSSSADFSGYDLLCLPDLPPRYHDLILPPDWYVSGKNAKRKHVATHGLRNFTALARTVASNWRVVDTVTLNYCKSVAQVIKERHDKLVNEFRSGLPPQHLKKQQQQKKKQQQQKKKQQQQKKKKSTTITKVAATTKPTVTMTTPPFFAAGNDVFVSCQHNQRSLIDMPISNINSPVLMPKQPTTEGPTPRSSYSNHDMERASATITPLSHIFDEKMSTSDSHQAYNELEYGATSFLMSTLDDRRTEDKDATRSLNIHAQHQDTSPLLYWENLNSAPDDEDVVIITDSEINEVLRLLNEEQ